MKISQDPINNLENLFSKNKVRTLSFYLILLLVITAFLLALPHIKLDITSQSRGVIRSSLEPVVVTSLVNGKLIAHSLKNNKTITKGDTLALIRNEDLKDKKNNNDSLITYKKYLYKDYGFLRHSKIDSLYTKEAQEIYTAFNSALIEFQEKAYQNRRNYNRNKTLFNKGVISRVEFESYQNKYRLSQKALESFKNQTNSNWQIKLRDLKEELDRLKVVNNNLITQASNYVITAPISGTLEKVLGVDVGSSINPSQLLAIISPNTSLIVENTVLPKDIGLLKVGQTLKVQLDAFNYNQWGMLEAKLIDIDKNLSVDNSLSYFKVRSKLENHQLQLKNGYTVSVKKGMTLTSRYFVTERSLYQLLFDKVDDWFNPKLIIEN